MENSSMEVVCGAHMEGWLYLIQTTRLMMTQPRQRYFMLVGSRALYYKEKPAHRDEAPIKSGLIDPCTRVKDHGRESFHGLVLFTFIIYDSYNNSDKLRFGARSPEEAAKWIQAFKDAADHAQPPGNDISFVPSGGRRRIPFRLAGMRGSGLVRETSGGKDHFYHEDSTTLADWTGSLPSKDASPDVIADSPWQIFGCKNGLRLFRETNDQQGLSSKTQCEDSAALMAVGVVHATCESVFATVMALGPSRAEWDFCFLRGRVIEHIDGHSDVIHKQFNRYWTPWRMKPRDLVIHRYWRREDDGSYVILYRSVTHQKCPPRQKFVRAWLKSGGYVISPLLPQGGNVQRCLVKHVLTVDWKHWNTCWSPACDKDITLHVLERVASIREMYKVKPADYKPIPTLVETERWKVKGGKASHEDGQFDANKGKQHGNALRDDHVEPKVSTFLKLADDEFYDVPEDSSWEQDHDPELESQNVQSESEGTSDEDKSGGLSKFSAAATIVKRLQAAAQKRTQHGPDEDVIDSLFKEGSLPKCSILNTTSCVSNADASTFLIRGKQYLRDHKKVVAKEPIMQFVAADWLKSGKREDHLASRTSNLVQRFCAKQRMDGKLEDPFFFIVNLQVPGTTCYSLVLYYMSTCPLSDSPLLENFVNGDNRYRNSRFKLIPNIAKGSWIVKQSVGKTACLIGEALEISYYNGKNYLELDVDIGSSSVARGVVNLVVGYLSKLVIELAFLIQANTEEELPEYLLGTCRLINLDVAKAVPTRPG
ncbi:hypothetical protein CY35_17G012900 [Sphagnum magellanicum]|nr:hypothetical protein CY35_17G012900 [Sphagnum magellanicum]